MIAPPIMGSPPRMPTEPSARDGGSTPADAGDGATRYGMPIRYTDPAGQALPASCTSTAAPAGGQRQGGALA